MNFWDKVTAAAKFLKDEVGPPRVIVVLTGGLEGFVEHLGQVKKFTSSSIPHFPRVKAQGHAGEMFFGTKEGVPFVVLGGRCHYYEGNTIQDVVFPYFVLHQLGAKALVTTNAVGGIREDLDAGDLVLITDHINFMGVNPLVGIALDRGSEQFTSMTEPYSLQLRGIFQKEAARLGLALKEGTYIAVSGPSYETKAEIRAFARLGADIVGMSTVPEVITANFLKMPVVSVSIVANPAAVRHRGKMSHDEVLRAVKDVSPKLVRLLEHAVPEIARKVS